MTPRHRSIRLRLTLTYGVLFLLCGAVLLGLNFAVLNSRLEAEPPPPRRTERPRERPENEREFEREVREEFRQEAIKTAAITSAAAFGAIAIAAFGIGWLVSSRMLRPLKDITDTARNLSEQNLHERIDLEGPEDELKELADTFDSMLERLDSAFTAQKEFVANASHELRTPLTLMRTEVDVALDNPDADPKEYEEALEAIRVAVFRAQALIDRLLVLARSEGPVAADDVDLAEVADVASDDAREVIAALELDVERDLGPARVVGDRALLERLVGNLIENAARYNVQSGWMRVSTSTRNGTARVQVANSGEPVPREELDELFDRFRRLDRSRDRRTGGFGLGLSIVRAVAAAHGGTVRAEPLTDGGLEVTVELPSSSAGSAP